MKMPMKASATRQRIRMVWIALSAVLFAAAEAMSAVAAGAAKRLVYVPLGSENRIVIIDGDEDRIVGKIGGLPAVHGLAGTPDGRLLVAGSYQVRQQGDEMPARPDGVAEDEHAAHHASSAAGSTAPASGISTVSVIRAEDRDVVRRIDVPGAVHHVTVNPEGTIAVVTLPDESAIAAIDLRNFGPATTVRTGAFPNYAAFSPDGNAVYVSNAGDGTITALDAANWNVRWSVAVGASPEHIVLSPEGRLLYVNNVDDGTVSVVDVVEERTIDTIPIGATLHGIDVSEDGKTLYVAALGDDAVTAVDLRTGARRNITLAPAPYHLANIREGGKLYVSSADEPKIWVVDSEALTVFGEILIGGKGHQMVQGAAY